MSSATLGNGTHTVNPFCPYSPFSSPFDTGVSNMSFFNIPFFDMGIVAMENRIYDFNPLSGSRLSALLAAGPPAFNIPFFNTSLAEPENATYCMNPQASSCLYGPCRDPRIGGIGTVVTLATSNLIFTTTLVHGTNNIRSAWWGQIFAVYSLVVPTFQAIARRTLTQIDAVFVIVAAAPPATIYPWYLSATHLLQDQSPGLSLLGMSRTERRTLMILSIGVIFLWIAMLPMVLDSFASIPFSQPACNGEYGWTEITNLIWVWVSLVSWFPLVVWGSGYQRPLGYSQNILRWTQGCMTQVFRRHGILLWKHSNLVLFLVMMDHLLSYTHLMKTLSFTIEFFAFFCILLIYITDITRRRPGPGIVDVLILLVYAGFLASFWWIQISPVLIITHIIRITALWNHGRNVYRPFALIILLSTILYGDRTLRTGPYNGHLLSQFLWFSSWAVLTVDSAGGWRENIAKIWLGIFGSSSVFKFIALVAGPNLSWIYLMATFHDPTKFFSLSFVQMCAIIINMTSVSYLILIIIRRRYELFAAFWFVGPLLPI